MCSCQTSQLTDPSSRSCALVDACPNLTSCAFLPVSSTKSSAQCHDISSNKLAVAVRSSSSTTRTRTCAWLTRQGPCPLSNFAQDSFTCTTRAAHSYGNKRCCTTSPTNRVVRSNPPRPRALVGVIHTTSAGTGTDADADVGESKRQFGRFVGGRESAASKASHSARDSAADIWGRPRPNRLENVDLVDVAILFSPLLHRVFETRGFRNFGTTLTYILN